jgi:hypothetical protein
VSALLGAPAAPNVESAAEHLGGRFEELLKLYKTELRTFWPALGA